MYAKIFQQIYDSSIVEKPEVRFTFMDLLVLADPDGVVDMTHGAIARRTNRPIEVIRATIAELEAPDPQSRTPDADGARLMRLDTHRDWGWCIINFDRFHKLASETERRAHTRDRVAKHRNKARAKPPCNAPVTPRNAPITQKKDVDVDVDVDTDVHTDVKNSLPPDGGKKVSEKKPKKPKAEAVPRKPKERNKYWDAVCDIFGMNPVTKQDKSRLGRLARDFKLKCEAGDADPVEIEARRDVLALRWAKNDVPVVITPEALLKHWDSAEDTSGVIAFVPPTQAQLDDYQAMFNAMPPEELAVERLRVTGAIARARQDAKEQREAANR